MKVVSGFDLHCYELQEYQTSGIVRPLAIVFGNTPSEAENRAAILGAAYDMWDLIQTLVGYAEHETEDFWLSEYQALKLEIEGVADG